MTHRETGQALDCATQQLIHLGYTIEAGDGVVGAPTKRGSADADSIMATCAGQTASGNQGETSR